MSVKVIAATLLVLMLAGAAWADPPPPAQSDPISIDPMSPSVLGGPNFAADIYGEVWGAGMGGWDVGGPGPVLHIPFFNYGLIGWDNNDAHSLGDNDPNMIPIVYFSAHRRSLGMWATQYRHQAIRNQAAGDRFVTNGWMDRSPANSYATGNLANLVVWMPGFGQNLLSANQTRYNEIPTIPQWIVNPIMDPNQIDDMDALELHAMDVDGDQMHDQPLFFSLDAGSPSMPAGASPADIFVSPPMMPGFMPWALAPSMGLQAWDDIDALVVFHQSGAPEAMPGVDYALFSLEPGNSLGADPSDVYVTSFMNSSVLYFTGPTVGLRKPDILDGLDVEDSVGGAAPPQVWDEIEEEPVPPLDTISNARRNPDGTLVHVSGIVTLIGPDYLYIEQPDRWSGIRVQGPPPWYVAVGDDLQVIGILNMFDGERVIDPTQPVSPFSSGNPVPAAFDMRSRAVGGGALDIFNPGITFGRGALNVGLRVRYMGMVTATDPAAPGPISYVWDGANHIYPWGGSQPVQDGTGNLGVRIEGGAPGMPWADWVDIVGVVSTDAMTVPGRVIPVIIPESAVPVMDFDVIDICSLEAPWNLIGLPAAPAGTSNGWEHSPKPWDPPEVITGGDPWALDARMSRWESCNQSLYVWDIWSDDHTMNLMWGPFGGALLGDGYWLRMDRPQPIVYSGKYSSLDQWISICLPGWILIGHPRPFDLPLAEVSVHDGGEIKSMYNASLYGAGWLNSLGYWWDATFQSLNDVGLPDDWPMTTDLYKCHGYWFEIYQGTKAFIVPGQPVLTFNQQNFDLGGVVTTDSDWGSVDLTFTGDPEILYFNLAVNGTWQVENIPVVSNQGVGVPQTMTYSFDLGVPPGTDVTNIQYDYSLTPTVQAAMPGGSLPASVTDRWIVIDSGIQLQPIPPVPAATPLGGGGTPVAHTHGTKFPNQDCGVNECVPAAVSNSLKFLNDKHNLGLTDAQTSIATMRGATGCGPNGAPVNWYDYKDAYMQANGYPVTTTVVNVSDIGDEIDKGQDVELTGDWHCAAVVGTTDLGGGKSSIDVAHDTKQGQAGGTKTETVTYDSTTGKLSGSPGFFDGSGVTSVVSECPAEESPG